MPYISGRVEEVENAFALLGDFMCRLSPAGGRYRLVMALTGAANVLDAY
jgi:hypothetical protein